MCMLCACIINFVVFVQGTACVGCGHKRPAPVCTRSTYVYVFNDAHTFMYIYMTCMFLCTVRTCTVRVKITCPNSRVLLRRFAASITRIHYACTRTTVEDHGCTGKGKHATRTTTQGFSRPMPLPLLYHAPSFGCSSFFVYRGLCKNHLINVRGHTQCYT